MEHDRFARHVVSPYGETHVVQAGIAVKRGRSLRETFTHAADTSQADLNPEAVRSIKMRLLHDAS